MKKPFLFATIVSLLLTACGSQPASKTEAGTLDPNELPAGIMRPVADSGASEGSFSWPSEIQSAPMPTSMAK